MEIQLFKYVPHNPFTTYSEEYIAIVNVKTTGKVMEVEGRSERIFVSRSHAIKAWVKYIYQMINKGWMVNDTYTATIIEEILRKIGKEREIDEETIDRLLVEKYQLVLDLKAVRLANEVESTEIAIDDYSSESVKRWICLIHELLDKDWSIIQE